MVSCQNQLYESYCLACGVKSWSSVLHRFGHRTLLWSISDALGSLWNCCEYVACSAFGLSLGRSQHHPPTKLLQNTEPAWTIKSVINSCLKNRGQSVRHSMPTQKELQHRRTHNLLLIQKLLSGRENASPFTLVLDSLEQSGRPLVREIMRRATVS
jgi:hypothetical protein